jgi:primosomal protein N' (replication factor Y)
MPQVGVIDLRHEPPERGEFLSPRLKHAMAETLAKGEQVLLFLNRRGYAPLLLCRACGHRFQCRHCSAWLVVHGRSRLECHHCGHREPLPAACPSCAATADKLAAGGPGVERIAEEVQALFPQAETINESPRSADGPREPETEGRTKGSGAGASSPPRAAGAPIKFAVLSSDDGVAAETWEEIERGKIDILIGTQMVAKGHHFPKLTLVAVVDADAGLSGADPRAGERTYQLLHQLSGRAGRGDAPGTVLIQTYLPDHPVMQALAAQDRDKLMALEAGERKAGHWPPYGQLAAVLLDGPDEAAVRAAGQSLARSAPDDKRLEVLGPAPAPLSRLRGQYRYRLLIKAEKGIKLQATLRQWLEGQKFQGVRVKLDVNPYYFL